MELKVSLEKKLPWYLELQRAKYGMEWALRYVAVDVKWLSAKYIPKLKFQKITMCLYYNISMEFFQKHQVKKYIFFVKELKLVLYLPNK